MPGIRKRRDRIHSSLLHPPHDRVPAGLAVPLYKLRHDADCHVDVLYVKRDEDHGQYENWRTSGWAYESSATQARLFWSNTMSELPNLTIITHHADGMVLFLEVRVGPGWDQMGARTSAVDDTNLPRELGAPYLDIFHRSYADTSMFGSSAPIECAPEFYGLD